MKQHITLDQLNELSEEQKRKLPTQWIHQDHDRDSDSWCYSCSESVSPEDKTQYAPALLSIGQMIEFLGDRWFEEIRYVEGSKELVKLADSFDDIYYINNDGLCDALWEAINEKFNIC